MAEKTQNVQDVFLNHVRKNKNPVTVFLVNGVSCRVLSLGLTIFRCFCAAMVIRNWFINTPFRP